MMNESKSHKGEVLYESDVWKVMYYGDKSKDEKLDEFSYKDYGYVVLARKKDGNTISVGLSENLPFERDGEIMVSGPRIKRFYYSIEEDFSRLNELLEELETI